MFYEGTLQMKYQAKSKFLLWTLLYLVLARGDSESYCFPWNSFLVLFPYSQNGFQLGVVKRNQGNHSSQSEDTDNPVNQSKLEVNTCSWRKARENGVRVSHDWFWFYSPLIGWKSGARFLLLVMIVIISLHYKSLEKKQLPQNMYFRILFWGLVKSV